MPYHLHRMRQEDIVQVTEIDHEAFPNQWPMPDYRNELRNPLAHYIVACDNAEEHQNVKSYPERQTGVMSRLKHWLNRNGIKTGDLPPPPYRVVGFAGIWLMANEAHLVSIAVRHELQRRGIGELLLIAIIELARELKANMITLEVRVSNTSAQKLYEKYDFVQVGLRKGYYPDNKEDALLMSTENINSAPFLERFQQLKAAYSPKLGITTYLPATDYPVPPDRR